MFGFLIGTASLFGLIKTLRGGCGGYGGGWHGHHGWHGRGRWQGGEGRFNRGSWMLRMLFRRLDTTAGQEKVFEAAAEDLQSRAREVRSEMEELRRQIAKSLSGEQFDAAQVRESFAKQRALFEGLEEAVIGHLGKVHEVLSPEQRKTLGELVEYGPRAMHGGGCHGGWRGRAAC